jgi:hypothetical protein
MTWNSSDAWLLQTIMQSTVRNPAADLNAIIAVGDYINHAIFNWEEFRDGMENLLRAKYVKVTKGKISLTPVFHEAYKSPGKIPKSMNKEYEQVLKLLQTKIIADKKTDIKFSEDDFRKAVNHYLKRT